MHNAGVVCIAVPLFVLAASPLVRGDDERRDQGPGKPASAWTDVAPRRIEMIKPGTEIGDDPPRGWSHLVLLAKPRIGVGDVHAIPKTAIHYGSMFSFTMLANVRVEGNASGDRQRYFLERVAIGMATNVQGRNVIVTSEQTSGGDFGFIGRAVMRENDRILGSDIRQVAHANDGRARCQCGCLEKQSAPADGDAPCHRRRASNRAVDGLHLASLARRPRPLRSGGKRRSDASAADARRPGSERQLTQIHARHPLRRRFRPGPRAPGNAGEIQQVAVNLGCYAPVHVRDRIEPRKRASSQVCPAGTASQSRQCSATVIGDLWEFRRVVAGRLGGPVNRGLGESIGARHGLPRTDTVPAPHPPRSAAAGLSQPCSRYQIPVCLSPSARS